MAGSGADPFWETAEAVERFTSRDPDVRLLKLLGEYPEPGSVRVLDLGCAAGRNTVALAERGFDVVAIDSSAAMVARTTERLAGIVGPAEAESRVMRGSMDDLGCFADGSMALVVALGVLHQAGSGRQWKGAVGEIRRVLRAGGLLLVAAWSPRSRPDGQPLRRILEGDHVYEGFHSGLHYLVDAGFIDDALASIGLVAARPTEEVEVEMERGSRVTVNGLYRKTHGPGRVARSRPAAPEPP